MAGAANSKSCYLAVDMGTYMPNAQVKKDDPKKKSAYLEDQMRQERSVYATGTFTEKKAISTEKKKPEPAAPPPAQKKTPVKPKPKGRTSVNRTSTVETIDEPTTIEKATNENKKKKGKDTSQEATDVSRISTISAVVPPKSAVDKDKQKKIQPRSKASQNQKTATAKPNPILKAPKK